MGIAPEVSLVVKHTFLEYIRTPSGKSGRPFTILPDAEQAQELGDVAASALDRLLEGVGLISSSKASLAAQAAEEAAEALTEHTASHSGAASSAGVDSSEDSAAEEEDEYQLQQPPAESPWCGPSEAHLWPTTPVLEAVFEPRQQRLAGDMVDLEATNEVKAVLGMAGLDCINEAEGLTDLETQAWLPPALSEEELAAYQQPWVFVPFADFHDCCGMQASCWAEQPMMWQLEEDCSAAGSTAFPSPSSSSSPPSPGRSGSESAQTAAAAQAAGALGEVRTTVMLRNLPGVISRDALMGMLESMGFGGQFDLVYIPVDFSSGAGLGYAFINMVAPEYVAHLWECFDGFSIWGEFGIDCDDDKVCSVSWSDPHQGLQAHVERYQNSPVMHPDVPDDWKPALFVQGIRVDFPSPTKKIKAPKVRSKKGTDAA